jgi:Nitrite and sulphite reductase 4Fe-4S domain
VRNHPEPRRKRVHLEAQDEFPTNGGLCSKGWTAAELKITGGQRIDLLGVRKEDLPRVWADLDMPSGYAYSKSFRTVKTCVGREFCRFGLGDSTQLGIDVERRYDGLESPAKMKLAVSGCPRNCAESYVKDVGIVAIEGRPVGNLCRRRGRGQRPQGRPAGNRRAPGGGPHAHRTVPAVLPGKRQMARTQLGLRPPDRASRATSDPRPRPRRDRSPARPSHPAVNRCLP